VVDPLDGTTNFAHGFPVFSVSLALLVDGEPVLGAICDPLRDDLYWAQRGQGAWRNGQRLRVSTTADLGSSLLATGFAYDRATNPDNNLAEFSYFMPRTRGVRRAGSAVLDMAWLASGWLDGYWERGTQVWDAAAGALLVREAGGLVTTYGGRPWQVSDRNVLASNGVESMHAALRDGLAVARQALPALG
jgi:myo-inositol-1(or 4)-monophosphatase